MPGDLLEGSWEDWLLDERERLRDRYVDALRRATDLAAGTPLDGAPTDHREAIRLARELLRCDPLREDSHRLLMRLHDEAGDRAAALRAYHECEAVLRRELGVEPSAETAAAYHALMRRVGPAAAASSTAAAESSTATAASSPASLVGRAAEWAMATAAWRAVEGGGPRLLLVAGEPGIGKTHLVEELARWCRQGGAVVAQARSYGTEGELGYGVVVSWLRHSDISAHLDRLRPGELVELARLLPELEPRTAPPRLADGPTEEAERRRRLFDAIARALLATGRPTLLVADDAQWCDAPTLQFLHYLVRLDPTSPLLVVATARREDSTSTIHCERSSLACTPSSERTSSGWSASTGPTPGCWPASSPARALDSTRLDELQAETEGNPLFIVETVRAGAAASGAASSGLSPRLQAVIGTRLRQLSGGTRDLLGLAATVGREFTAETLAAASELDQVALVAGLDELWRRGIVRELGTDAYDFAHGRIRDVAYEALSPATRRRNHVRIAEALVRLHDREDRGAEVHSGQVARHLDLGGQVTEAVDWYRRAAVEAQRRRATGEALRLLERARDLVDVLPESPRRRTTELAVLSALPTPLAVLEGFGSDRLAATQARAVELARMLGVDPDPSVLRSLAMSNLCRNEPGAARAVAGQLHELAARSGDEVLLVESEYLLAIAAFWGSEFEVARAGFEGVVGRFRADRRDEHLLRFGQDPQLVCLSRLANTLWFLGEGEAAAAARAEALARADEVGHPFSLGVVLVFSALLAVDLGEPDRFRQYVAHLRAAAEHQPQLIVADVFEGYLDVLDGRAADGIRRIRAAYDSRPVNHAPGQRSTHLRLLLAAHEAAGDAEGGLAATDDAERLTGTNIWAAEGRRLRAEFLAALGAPGAAVEAALAEAAALARSAGAAGLERRVEASRARLGVGR